MAKLSFMIPGRQSHAHTQTHTLMWAEIENDALCALKCFQLEIGLIFIHWRPSLLYNLCLFAFYRSNKHRSGQATFPHPPAPKMSV